MQGSSVQSQHSAEWRCLLLAVSGRVSSSSSAMLALNRIIATPLYGSPQAPRKSLLFHTQHLQYVQSQQGPAVADLKQTGTLMQHCFQGSKKFYWLLVWIATVSYMPTCNDQMYNFDLVSLLEPDSHLSKLSLMSSSSNVQDRGILLHCRAKWGVLHSYLGLTGFQIHTVRMLIGCLFSISWISKMEHRDDFVEESFGPSTFPKLSL